MSNPVRVTTPVCVKYPQRTIRRAAVGSVALTLALAPLLSPSAHAALPRDAWEPSMCWDFTPSNPEQGNPFGNAWHVDRLEYDKLDQLGVDGSGVKVAVIDSGVDPTNSPLYQGTDIEIRNYAKIADGDNFKNNKGKISRLDCNHGSTVLGLLAAKGGIDPRTTFRGIAPGVEVIMMRSLEDTTAATRDKDQPESLVPTINAVNEAVDAKVDIISISQSGGDSPEYAAAIARAVDAGILVVAAAGNSGPNAGDSFPASYPGVMAVGMTTNADAPDPNSQSGPNMVVSVAAPGTHLTSAVPMCVPATDQGCTVTPSDKGAYLVQTGTSYATPLVTGTAALLMQRYPNMTAPQVKKRIEDTADPTGTNPPDKLTGHGVINPYRALVAPTQPGGQGAATPTPAPPKRHAPPPAADSSAERNIALLVAGTALGIVGVAAVIAAALPSGRSRRWRPARDR